MGNIRRGSWWTRRKMVGIALIAILGIFSLHTYNVMSNQKIEFSDLELSSKEVVAGDSLTSTMEVRRVYESKGPILSLIQKNRAVWTFLRDIFSQEDNANFLARMKIDGKTYSEKRISLDSEESKKVTFRIKENKSGRHTLIIGNLSQNFFVVLEPLKFEVRTLVVRPEKSETRTACKNRSFCL